MPVFRATVRQAVNNADASYKWSNVWYINTSDLGSAVSATNLVAETHRQILDGVAFVYEMYVSDTVPNTTVYQITQPPSTGLGLMGQSGEFMPSFVTVRCDFFTATSGRPSRKFFRAPWREGTIVAGRDITNVQQTALEQALENFRNIPGICDESGNPFSSASVRAVTSKRLGRYAGFQVPPQPTP